MRRNRVVKIISTLIMLFFLANAVYALLLWGRSTGVAGAIFNLLTVVSCGAIACCMFAWLYLPGLIDSLFRSCARHGAGPLRCSLRSRR